MGSFYGDIKHSNRVSLIFDKIYSSRKDMEDALSKEGGDEIYHGRYVFVDYGEQTFAPYIKTEITSDDLKTNIEEWYTKVTILPEDFGSKDFYIFTKDGEYILATTFVPNEQYYIKTQVEILSNQFAEGKQFYEYDEYSKKYKLAEIYKADTDYYYFSLQYEGKSYNTINEHCEYAKNRKKDEQFYGDCFHHTVWKKVWTQVGENQTAEEKYILVAYLDAQAPNFELITDAPRDLTYLVYNYDVIGSDLYDYTNLSYIVKEDNYETIVSILGQDIINCNSSYNEQICYTTFKENYNKYNILSFTNLHDVINNDLKNNENERNKYYKRTTLTVERGLLSEEKFLSTEEDLYLKDAEQQFIKIEGINSEASFYNAYYKYPGNFFEEPNTGNIKPLPSPFLSANKSAYVEGRNYYYQDFKYTKQQRIEQLPITTAEKLINEINNNKTNIIISKNKIEDYENNIDFEKIDFYSFTNYIYQNGQEIYTEVQVTKNNFKPNQYYIKVNDSYQLAKEYSNTTYYNKSFEKGSFKKTPVYTNTSPENLIKFNVLKEYIIKNAENFNLIVSYANEGLVCYYDNNQYKFTTTYVSNAVEKYYVVKMFDINKYYYKSLYNPFIGEIQKIFLRRYSVNEGYPHFDPLRSTDLNYKLHIPRNWKFSNTTDFQYNKSGFEKAYSYKDSGNNDIFLTEYSSGELYPEHLEEVPEAAKYGDKGELQKTAQIDTKKFVIDLPEIGNAISEMWDIIYPIGYFAPVNNPDIKTPENYYKKINEDLYERLGASDFLDIENETYYTFISEKDANYNDITKRRYLFIGNDRAVQDFNYPQTAAEVIRYIYNLIGLNTDNDYLSIPPSKTIYGLKNGLETLLGSFNDEFSENYILPIYQEKYIQDQNYLKVGYGNAGTVQWTNNETLSKEVFNLINESAWGPLYKAHVVEYRPSTTVTANNFNENIASFIAPNVKIQYYKKNGDSYIKADAYSEGLYEAEILYEKATIYEPNIVYYRNVNSLWSLLKEFQDARENYQPDWNVDNPISPKHIQNRPKLIFSTSSAEDKIDDLNTEYSYWNIIESTPIILNENLNPTGYLKTLITTTTGFIEVNKDNNEITYKLYRNNTDIADFVYIPTREYFKVTFEDHDSTSIEDKWTLMKVVTSNSLDIYDWDATIKESTTLRVASLNEISNMIEAVENNTWNYDIGNIN